MSAVRLISPLNVLMALVCSVVVGCGGSNSQALPQNDQPRDVAGNDGPEGSSALSINDISYPLNAALGDQWGPEDEHYRIDFTVTNGNFRVELVVVDGVEHSLLVPAQATAVFHAKMYSPGDSFTFANYGHASSAVDNSLLGVAYFTDGFVGVDTNLDDVVDEHEQFSIIDGVVQFTGSIPDIDLQFAVTLSNGQQASGNYTGLYDFTLRH